MVVERERVEGSKPGRVGTRPEVVDECLGGKGEGIVRGERSVSMK